MKKLVIFIIFVLVGFSLISSVYNFRYSSYYNAPVWTHHLIGNYYSHIKDYPYYFQIIYTPNSPVLWTFNIDSLDIKNHLYKFGYGYLTFSPENIYMVGYSYRGLEIYDRFEKGERLISLGKQIKTTTDTLNLPVIFSLMSVYKGEYGESGMLYQYKDHEFPYFGSINTFLLSYVLSNIPSVKGDFYYIIQGYSKNDTIKRGGGIFLRSSGDFKDRTIFPLIRFSYFSPNTISMQGIENSSSSVYFYSSLGLHVTDILYLKPLISYRSIRGYDKNEYSFYMRISPPVLPSISTSLKYLRGNAGDGWSQFYYHLGLQKFFKGWNILFQWKQFFDLGNSYSGYSIDSRVKRYFYRSTSAWFYFRKDMYNSRSSRMEFDIGSSILPLENLYLNAELKFANYGNGWFTGFRSGFTYNRNGMTAIFEYKYNNDGMGRNQFSFTFSKEDTIKPMGLASIKGVVYVDVDENNRYNVDMDYPVEGVKIILNNGKEAITDAEGKFQFLYLPKGRYTIKMDESEIPAYLGIYVENEIDVDLNFFSSASVEFPLSPLGAIEGYIFMDNNRNGVRDEGEEGVGGVVVYLDGTDRATVTDRDGHYIIGNLPFGTYRVMIRNLPPDTQLSLPNVVTIIKIKRGKEERNVDIGIAKVKRRVERKRF